MRVNQCSNRALLFLAVLGAPYLAHCDELVRPVVMVLSGDNSTIRSASDDSSRRATAGREAYLGEKLSAGSEPITFAYCPSVAQLQPAVFVLAAGSAIQISDQASPAGPGLRPLEHLPICDFPQVDTTALAANVDTGAAFNAPLPAISSRIATLSPESQARIRNVIDKSEPLFQQPTYSLIGHATRAAAFENAGLLDDALAELRTIRETWYEATWTRNVITRLNRRKTIEPDIASYEKQSPGLESEPVSRAFDPKKGRTYALLIGISNFKDSNNTLHFADKDAMAFADFLRSPRGGKLNQGQIKLLTNQDASLDRIQAAITEFVRGKANHQNTLILFVASHGVLLCTKAVTAKGAAPVCDAEAEEPFILTYDSYANEGKTTGIPMAEFRDMITQRANEFGRVLVFLDVCHAGRLDLPPSTRLNAPALTQVLAKASGMVGILLGNSLARSPEQELTYERSSYQHGIFTYYTLLGLNSEIRPTDGKIYFVNLSHYVSDQVTNVTDRKQIPYALSPQPDLVAVDDAEQLGISLTLLNDAAGGDTSQDIPRGQWPRALSPFEGQVESAITRGHLLPGEPGSAFDLVRNTNAPGATADERREAVDRVRIALEEKGQSIIVKYLKGDEVPQVESDFVLGSRYFHAALQLAPDSAYDESRFLFCRGRAEIFDKHYAEAERTLDTAVRIDPERAYAHNAQGITFLEEAPNDASNLGRAINAFQTAIQLAPYWAYARHNLALTFAEAGMYSDAIREYQGAIALSPSYSYLPYNLGLLYQQINDLPKAEAAYKNALALSKKSCSGVCPGVARSMTAMGVLFESRGKYKKAEEQFRLALKADPLQADTKHDLASLLASSRRGNKEAETLWLENLRLQPEHVPSLIGICELLRKSGRYSDALPFYKRLNEVRPQYVPEIIGYADSLTATGAPQTALQLLDNAPVRAQTNFDFWVVRLRTRLALQDRASAADDYAHALRLSSTRAQKKAVREEFERRIAK